MLAPEVLLLWERRIPRSGTARKNAAWDFGSGDQHERSPDMLFVAE